MEACGGRLGVIMQCSFADWMMTDEFLTQTGRATDSFGITSIAVNNEKISSKQTK